MLLCEQTLLHRLANLSILNHDFPSLCVLQIEVNARDDDQLSNIAPSASSELDSEDGTPN